MAPILKTLRQTVFKTRPIQSSSLPDEEKHIVEAGQQFELHSYTFERNHVRFALSKESFKGRNTWYAFGQHVQIFADGGKQAIAYPKPRPNSIKLPVPYKSQLDNWYNPTGSCNVTSIAMCLEYLKTPRKTYVGQFEDELYQYALSKGLNRHEPEHLAIIVRDYGRKDDFKRNATIDAVKDWLAARNPCVIHGYFTSFGHIIVVVGYDPNGFIVHDPYGEWFSDGYRTDLSGAYLHYSYGLIRRTCIPDGSFWVHFISA
ncbi:MAG: C39 family peptidase [Oscillatoriaceae bacterium SKW80]|nr:C39 family peptidase [Oscillatoriaceae bacterium SKYG93]MCX8122085.1 C39 family peptidase [Oscillatoriaceae bacterium SKW80]HIK29236.1 C39 family peptidase [Oscillatoriaceae cyanobacterium M7585_C2015_266]